jgi:hypothetical protein
MTAPTDNFSLIADTAIPTQDVGAVSRPADTHGEADIIVVDDLPQPMPVMAKEADVVEMHLAALLDALLGSAGHQRARRV